MARVVLVHMQDKTTDFLFELGMLKQLKRSGWLTIGIRDCESVAEHSFRTAAIAYLLAKSEKLSAEKTEKLLAAAIFHDLAEARTGDLNTLNKKYAKADSDRAAADMLTGVEPAFADAIHNALADTGTRLLLHDADRLEMLLQALEYLDLGNSHAAAWVESARKGIKTAAGKKLLAEIMRTPPKRWLFSIKERGD